MATFKEHLHLPVTMIDDSQRMLSELQVTLRVRVWVPNRGCSTDEEPAPV